MEIAEKKAVCPWCVHAWMNEDPEKPCGLICEIGKENKDGKCGSFVDYLDLEEQMIENINENLRRIWERG